jgi:hypothetical protein
MFNKEMKMELFSEKSSDTKYNAQRNLEGRTHYVDDDSLRFHKSRILSTHVGSNGLIFALIESYAADYQNTRRLFRPVVFDIFGTVISRVELEEGYKSKEAARKKLDEILNSIDAQDHTLKAIDKQQKYYIDECQRMRAKVSELVAEVA